MIIKLLNINLDLRFPRRYYLKNPKLSQRLKILKREIYEQKLDFITFQEMTDVLLLGNLKALFFHPYAFVVKGILRVRGGLCTTYNYRKWRFVYKKFTPFSDQGKLFSREIADRLLRKGILLSIFDHKKTGDRVVIINVHFTANYGHKESEEERKVLQMQLAELKTLLNDKKHIGRVTLVSGDFNADFTSPTILGWVKETGARLAFPIEQCTICPSHNPAKHEDQTRDMQVDNILCLGKCGEIKSKLLFDKKDEYISDHLGQLISLKL